MEHLPDGMSEAEVLDIIDNVVRRLAYKFRFGYHEVEDIMQEGRLAALKALPRYDNVRPLENFLWTAVRNGLFNNKRNNYERPDIPCQNCPLNAYDKENDKCLAYEDKMECTPYSNWANRNASKKNIMNPIGLQGVADEHEKNMRTYDDVDAKLDLEQFFLIIDENIALHLKPDFIRLRNGVSVPKPRREKVYAAIKDILAERGLDEPEAW